MKRLLILFMLVASPVMACESYEECMMDCKHMVADASFSKTFNGKAVSEIKTKESACYQAIAYKLDEISKKLDRGVPSKYEEMMKEFNQ